MKAISGLTYSGNDLLYVGFFAGFCLVGVGGLSWGFCLVFKTMPWL